MDISSTESSGVPSVAATRRLSQRELEILVQACEGKTDKEIAAELGLSTGSVRTYWERMRKKCEAVNRIHILALLTDAQRTLVSSLSDPRACA